MSEQMGFVTAAYAVTALATLAVTGWSWAAMRRAEARAATIRART